jgi:streptogrisin C
MSNEWKSGETYQTGDCVAYKGCTYKCITGHTAQENWTPKNVPALWTQCAAEEPPAPEPAPEAA